MERNKLAIFAGQGDLPKLLVDACRKQGRPYCIVAFEGNTPPDLLEGSEFLWTHFGAVGTTLEQLRERGVAMLVMAGRMHRPKLSALKPDAKAAKLMSRIGRGLFAGDDALLSTITKFLEEEGFQVIGADEILGEALTPAGVLGSIAPTPGDLSDIAKGVVVARALGQLDVGQAAIVQAGYVLGVEGLEGTDALIARCATLRVDEPGGVLVKVKKPKQERRADLPSMGIETVRRMKEAGFAGIAMEARHSLMLDSEAVIAAADAAGLFIYGVEAAS
jgi:DUF1009 family protein